MAARRFSVNGMLRIFQPNSWSAPEVEYFDNQLFPLLTSAEMLVFLAIACSSYSEIRVDHRDTFSTPSISPHGRNDS